MAFLSAKLREFGELHLALASYNAGERPVRRWIRDRPGLEREEFIDDIPYPQTQNYVKKILGTAEDYRRLYGPDSSREDAPQAGLTPAASARRQPTAPRAAADHATAKKASAVSPSSVKKKKPRKTA